MQIIVCFTLSLHFLLKVEASGLIEKFKNEGSHLSKEKHDGNIFFKDLSSRRVRRSQENDGHPSKWSDVLEEKTQKYNLVFGNKKESKRLSFPYVRIKIQDPKRQSEKCLFHIDVPLEPNMSVMMSLTSAARQFSRQNPNKWNPFAILLFWSTRDKCYEIKKVLSIRNTRLQLWRLVVQNSLKQNIFNGICIPEGLILRPGSQVSLVYS